MLVGCWVNKAQAAPGMDMISDTTNAMISTKPVALKTSPYGGLDVAMPKGLTQVAGFVSVVPLYQRSGAVLMITVNAAHKADMHAFLKKNGLDIAPGNAYAGEKRNKKRKNSRKFPRIRFARVLELLVLGEAVPAVYRPSFCRLEWHFAFLAAV